MAEKEQILDFFLNIFRLQCENPNPGARSGEYRLLCADTDEIYELRIQCGTEWQTRRMSICQLGETVESKSTIYKVIYDQQLVIKIPPKPFTDFNKYLEYINNERHIVASLTPAIQCLSPGLAPILSMIPDLQFSAGTAETDTADLENKYSNLLKTHSHLQKHLKIGPGFVFFMSLTRSEFFNQVIKKIHDKTRIQQEMLNNTSIFEDPYAFEALYGHQYDDVFFKLSRMYHEYGKIIDILLPQHENYHAVPAYKKQQWFYLKLGEEVLETDEKGLDDIFFQDLNQLIDILMEENEAAVIQYRGISEKYISKKIFDTNRKNIEGLMVNTLFLIYHLRNQNVAIRDLKPDNIYIAAPADGTDYFFSHPDTYSLGLIDLETAVHLHPHDISGMRQPALAGTFPFMTPHHLFRNRDLYKLFGKELCRVLYMQDWFAVIAIMFNVATGKILFLKTAKLMQKIFEIKKKAARDQQSLSDTLKSVSWIFWNTAAQECEKKLNLHSDKFRFIDITLPDPIVEMLRQELETEKNVIKKMIKDRINSKPVLKKIGRKLYPASAKKTAEHRLLWEKGQGDPSLSKAQREKIITILKTMESLKQQLEQHEMLGQKLETAMPASDLLLFLFDRVLNAMYRPFWTYRDHPLHSRYKSASGASMV